ncbi:chondroitinase-B domain-containing protein [Pedobacter cryoconitis]|uniref:Poly(Beta-D-mannuronate) lyase n=1 Tax=Pedobacter cryoconitis TaxID=188932 RepID=A0A327SVN2_9SPHI|nr:chondroitinase-B domain-containing protein [Pedobacter cryoconitis]RAJ32979.1 poly(beta-D-mannuronate) lyase [Pedobacter cryoconitis]
MKNLILSLLIVCSLKGYTSSILVNNTILVNNPQELKAAVSKARPGDVILLKDKEWSNAALQLSGKGTAAQPVIIRPETPGGVILTGQSYLQLSGEYLVVKDLHFKNGYTPKREVVAFRTSEALLGNHCRVTGIVIENYSQPEKFRSDTWVTFYGKNNRVDHSTFVNKLNLGPVIIAELNDERSQQNDHLIDSNYFKGRSPLGSNGGETIRIGVSRYSLKASRTTIAHNFFERCNGEVEIVSIKSGENRVCFNTFFECEGGLVLRHGSDNVVEGNFFMGNNKPFTGGVRVINPRQKVFNNVFYQLQGTNFRAPLSVLNGVPNSQINRYYQVKDAWIEQNTFVDCSNILFGAGKDAERTLAPENVQFKKNLIASSRQEIYTDANNDQGIIFSENGVVNYAKSVSADVNPGKLPDGFLKIKADTYKINDITLPYSKLYGADLKNLKVITPDKTGAAWYHPETKKAWRKPKSTLLKASQSSLLATTLKEALAGDTIVLTEAGLYPLKEELIIDKTLVLMATKGLKNRPVFVNASFKSLPAFITLENGSKLTVKGIAFKGNYESFANADAGIRSTDKPMNKPYKLIIDDCEFYAFNESSNSGFSGSKSTLADSLIVKNSIFHHLSGTGIDLSAEKDDKGIYNAEYTLITNCVFTNVMGTAINIYRGGNDESTLGPFVNIDHCTFNEVENREQGSAVKLIGAQQVSILNSNFSYSGQGGRAIFFQEYRWDNIIVDHCNFYESGKVESFYQRVLGSHIYHLKPEYTDLGKLNLAWTGNAPASADRLKIGVYSK